MSIHSKRLKQITFTLEPPGEGEPVEFQCQLSNWQIQNNTEDGEKRFTFCGPGTDGEFREEADDDYMLELTFFSDWRTDGISEFLTKADQQTVAFVLDHHVDDEDSHVRWTGEVKIKAPTAGGDARAIESQTVTYPIIGKPVFEDNATVSAE